MTVSGSGSAPLRMASRPIQVTGPIGVVQLLSSVLVTEAISVRSSTVLTGAPLLLILIYCGPWVANFQDRPVRDQFLSVDRLVLELFGVTRHKPVVLLAVFLILNLMIFSVLMRTCRLGQFLFVRVVWWRFLVIVIVFLVLICF